MCVCVRVWRPRLLPVRNRNRHTQGKVWVKNLINIHRVPSRGVDPRVKFLDDANATHSSSFEHTPTPVLCRLCIVVLRKASSNRISLADETYSSSAFVSLQILIAFALNPIYTFPAASVTRGVCRFLSKQARRARFEFIQCIRDPATKIARDVSWTPQTYL